MVSRQERKLIMKLDWFILSYCCLMYFTNYLDRSNISNAYVSGMKEELDMGGIQFNTINTLFTCGYIVGMIPNNLMLQLTPPRIWFPSMQLLWGILTFCTSVARNVQTIYIIRFFQGMAESSTFVGTHYILGSSLHNYARWYKHNELGKRSGIFTSAGLAGTLFSGVLQAAVYVNLDGRAGRTGWRWLFIIDGIITLPIALYGFIVFPDVPVSTKAFYLSREDRLLAIERLRGEVQAEHRSLSWNTLKRILTRWRIYGCSLLFAVSGETESFGSNNLMGQYLKAVGHYTVEQIDYYPSGVTAFGIFSTLICAFATDFTRVRWPVLIYMSIACITASICILAWQSPTGLKFFAYYLSGASYSGQATTFAWANEICADDYQERGIVLASMNMWNNVINAWWPLLFYRATDAPQFKTGMITMICVSVATLVITYCVWYMEKKEAHKAFRHGRDTLAATNELEHNSGYQN